MESTLAEHFKEKMKKDDEAKDFIKTMKPNEYYEIPGTGKAIKGSQLKKLINGKGQSILRKS